jgi:DHA2 family multidrug resistance protein
LDAAVREIGSNAGAVLGSMGTPASIVQREANTLACIDGFLLTVWLATAALVFAALIGRVPPGPFTPASEN